MSDLQITHTQKRALLALARAAIARRVGRDVAPPSAAELGPERLAGAFVSLHKRGRLRGCIGTFSADEPVTLVIEEMAVAAAIRDPRFPALEASELDELELEISVLSPRREVTDVDQIEVGRHGLVVSRGASRGVLLPQVATEHGWDREAFLAHTCEKAGLLPDAWTRPGTCIEVFTAEVFSEHDV
jgi:uncharacterized protein